MSAPGLVAFASRDGHAAAIAARLAAGIGDAETHDLAGGPEPADRLRTAPFAVLVAAVRYGKHLPAAERFLAAHKGLAAPPPLALVSVNLTARKPEKSTPATNPYLKKLTARHGLEPAHQAVFAGKLDYPRYRWLDRQMIRLIMALTGGPTDPTTVVDYTDWAAVDAFAIELRAALASPASASG
ncbi:MAG: menaquinone-dependent protoporphyrinogen IX dehydrogenase [Alphaproteobacteria bacterium]